MQGLMILSECEEINSPLHKPIAATQRIKYTCINVSTNYIVLGSTSGSLYLFIREPCTFQQLIPLSEGPVSCVVISPDEKTIALATKRGSVCLIGIKPTVKLLALSSEHLGEMVTSLCWNNNSSEIYIGDGIGKISTMLLSIFSVNGMFQAPSCALMHLDSTIVQMEFSGHHLLVSTMTRCYICDTAQEQFKQIGNKARDGEFGACFFSVKSGESETKLKVSKKSEKDREETVINTMMETNGESEENKGTKIYCARPGCRLWEVMNNGTVIKTHQFKEALAIPPSPVYRTGVNKVLKNRQIEQNWIPQSTSPNFSHLYVLCGKYLLTHTSGSIYVIDPTNAAVILWNNEYTNITTARTIDDRIYLMRESGSFHCLRLATPETLILKCYEEKNYIECLRACKALKPEFLNNSTIGKKYSARLSNEDGEGTINSACEHYEISSILVPIISLIQSNLNSQPIKLNSGIVVVNSGKLRSDEKQNFDTYLKKNGINERDNFRKDEKFESDEIALMTTDDLDPVISENFVKNQQHSNEAKKNTAKDTEKCLNLMSAMNINIESSNGHEALSKDLLESTLNETHPDEIDETTLKIQTELNPVYVLINSLKPVMSDIEMEDIIINVRKTMSEIRENYVRVEKLKDFLYEILRSTQRHYYHILLDNITIEVLYNTKNENIVNEVVKSFLDVNISCMTECTCGFIYPNKTPQEPKFLEIGKTLLDKFFNDAKREDCIKLCNNVTFMWRYYLPMSIVDFTIIDDILCMCLCTRDNVVLSTILPMLDVRQWEIAVRCIRDMESGICPCCGKEDENLRTRNKMEINWSEVARELMKREGTSSAMTFLVLIETVLPNVKLDKSIFQSLIFTKILDHHGLELSVNFDKNTPGNQEYGAMCSPKIQEQLLESIEKDLERPVERNIFGGGPHHWGRRFLAKSLICPCCTLSLQTPILLGDNGISLFPCGHVYHVSCLIQRKLSRCNLH
ncbi:Hermansky-Pudlak syndrome 5 protein homolog [Venturia canescens]|uniref:Hermansky-Pudlak syndrome 5 protein homolog n=1 Tax=Venturia canescens TaxID=32260 RepID=UPI001C9BEDA2|nr:Hermansky-Pudlak syndrome 5 protein homolog [Venturia canescens]